MPPTSSSWVVPAWHGTVSRSRRHWASLSSTRHRAPLRWPLAPCNSPPVERPPSPALRHSPGEGQMPVAQIVDNGRYADAQGVGDGAGDQGPDLCDEQQLSGDGGDAKHRRLARQVYQDEIADLAGKRARGAGKHPATIEHEPAGHADARGKEERCEVGHSELDGKAHEPVHQGGDAAGDEKPALWAIRP